MTEVRLHFTDYFEVDPDLLRSYGAFNVSLISDLPLFVDPFLLFNSKKVEYQRLHDQIVKYLRFLRRNAETGPVSLGELEAWYRFQEVRENWLGFSKTNAGHGLGIGFAKSLATNLDAVFKDFGTEAVTKGSHLEKLTLIDGGVGRDGISDFTTNLIKGYLLDYTQSFAVEHIGEALRADFHVERVAFNYETESWASGVFQLPLHNAGYVLLTPRDILTRDDIWISHRGFVADLRGVIESVSNQELRARLNNYLRKVLPEEPTREDVEDAASSLARRFPEILDYYIRLREETGDRAVTRSAAKVKQTSDLFVDQVRRLAETLASQTHFYSTPWNTLEEARARALFLKDVVENKGGHRLFYLDGEPIRREEDLHILYRLTWYATPSDVSREANDGRGPADFKISQGAFDKTIVEFKLASNSQLARNLAHQVKIYQKASDAGAALKVIFFFNDKELRRVRGILEDLSLDGDPNVILVDARMSNKPSGSKAGM